MYFGLQSAILNYGSRPTSDNVGNVTGDSGVIENAGVAVGISVPSHSIPEIQCTVVDFIHFLFAQICEEVIICKTVPL